MKSKRIVVLSDFHCGHVVGLTPPAWAFKVIDRDITKRNKYAELQAETWKWYYSTIKQLQPIDILIVNGDGIDGRENNDELVCTSRQEQCEMAIYAIEICKPKHIVMTYGTAYHTGKLEDWENDIANEVKAKIGSHEWINVNGLIFDIKHHVSSSVIPHGRHTSMGRERLWNVLWTEFEEQPKADILIRSHVHYHSFCGGRNWIGMTTPALQAMGSRFGARRMSSHVEYGIISFDVNSKGGYVWEGHFANIERQKARTLKL